jgi:hypothetical protein
VQRSSTCQRIETCDDRDVRAFIVALAGSGCLAALHVTAPATIGDTAAPFALPAQDGRTVSLAAELAHGPVVLVFYRGYW